MECVYFYDDEPKMTVSPTRGYYYQSKKKSYLQVAKDVDGWLHTLSAKRVKTVCCLNENVVESENGGKLFVAPGL